MQVWFAIIAIVAFAFLIARAMREKAEKQRVESSHESEVTHHITEPLMGILGFMMAIIWADGEPDNAQIDATFSMLKSRFRLDDDEAPQAMGAASGLLHTAKDKDALLRDLGRLFLGPAALVPRIGNGGEDRREVGAEDIDVAAWSLDRRPED